MTVNQRKFFLVIGLDILIFLSLWFGSLPAVIVENLLIWINSGYLAANVWQKIGLKNDRNVSE